MHIILYMNELDCETSAPGLRLRIQFVMGPSFRGNFLPLFQQAFLLGPCGAAGFVVTGPHIGQEQGQLFEGAQ